jgi:hypothetical protein
MISEELTGKNAEVSVTEFMIYPRIFLEGLKKSGKNYGIWSSGQYLNSELSKFETGVDPTNHQFRYSQSLPGENIRRSLSSEFQFASIYFINPRNEMESCSLTTAVIAPKRGYNI